MRGADFARLLIRATKRVLEGSLRKAGNRIRVTAQLVEAETGNHVWAERYDRDLADIFAVQDEITEAVTIAIAPRAHRKDCAGTLAGRDGAPGLRRGLARATRQAEWQCLTDCRRASSGGWSMPLIIL
jgi:hypothetical protein